MSEWILTHVDNVTPEKALEEFIPYRGRLPKTLERYRNKIVDYDYDGETYQVWLVIGWRRDDDLVHCCLGDTVREIREFIQSAVPCDCLNCEHYKKQAAEAGKGD